MVVEDLYCTNCKHSDIVFRLNDNPYTLYKLNCLKRDITVYNYLECPEAECIKPIDCEYYEEKLDKNV